MKHFKWVQKGKLHMHATPNASEIAACRPWLESEIRAVNPNLIVCLGGTAATSVFGKPVKVLANRGQILKANSREVLITVHPSMLLRVPSENRAAAFEAFVKVLAVIKTRRSAG